MTPRIAPPTSRGFTQAEKRRATLERPLPYFTALVIAAAAVISFAALVYVGKGIGAPGPVAYLIPVAVDGFAVVCSLGIVRHQGEKHAGRQVTEWAGLLIAVALSVVGNVWHAVEVGAPTMPLWIKVVFGTAIPVFVAYNVHVYGRAVASGIAARVLVDDPTRVHTTLPGDAAPEPVRAPARTPRPVAASAPTVVLTKPPPAASAQPARQDEARAHQPLVLVAPARTTDQRIDDAVRAAHRADPATKPSAATIHRDVQSDQDPASTRRKVTAAWDRVAAEHQGAEPAAARA